MPRSGQYNQQKEQHWRGVIAAWHRSGALKSHFCRSNNIKLNHFCSWEKKLRLRDKQRAPNDKTEVGQRRPQSGRRAKPDGKTVATSVTRKGIPAFVEVNVQDSFKHDTPIGSGLDKIEIVLPATP